LAPSDPGITALSDGRYFVRWAQWQLKPRAKRDDLAGPVMRHYVRRGLVGYLYGDGFALSSDEGQTWFRMKSQSSGLASREGVLELRDGTLLLPGYGGYPEQTERAFLLRSWDAGLSWGDASPMAGEAHFTPYRAGRNVNECSLVALDDDTLLALLRVDTSFHTDDNTFMSEGGIGELAWTLSYDVGFTWEPLQPTGIFGQPGHLLRLADGSLLVTFGYRRAPFGVRAARVAFSPPGDWRVLACITLRDDGGGWDVGYPASAQLDDGSIFSVYYIYGDDGLRHIAGTHWTLAEMTPC
jgi:hypothetical protein